MTRWHLPSICCVIKALVLFVCALTVTTSAAFALHEDTGASTVESCSDTVDEETVEKSEKSALTVDGIGYEARNPEQLTGAGDDSAPERWENSLNGNEAGEDS